MWAVITIFVRHHAHILHLRMIVYGHRIRHRHHAEAADDSMQSKSQCYELFYNHFSRIIAYN